MANVELKTASGGSVTLVPEDGVSNVTATVKHESGVLASEQFALSNDFGIDQNWQDLLGSRSTNVTYTNTTSKPIRVAIGFTSGAGGSIFEVNFNGIVRLRKAVSATFTFREQFIVNPSETYLVSISSGSLNGWWELR